MASPINPKAKARPNPGPRAAFGVLVELIQWFLLHRTFSLQDIVPNAIGAATAAVLWLALKKRHGPTKG